MNGEIGFTIFHTNIEQISKIHPALSPQDRGVVVVQARQMTDASLQTVSRPHSIASKVIKVI